MVPTHTDIRRSHINSPDIFYYLCQLILLGVVTKRRSLLQKCSAKKLINDCICKVLKYINLQSLKQIYLLFEKMSSQIIREILLSIGQVIFNLSHNLVENRMTIKNFSESAVDDYMADASVFSTLTYDISATIIFLLMSFLFLFPCKLITKNSIKLNIYFY